MSILRLKKGYCRHCGDKKRRECNFLLCRDCYFRPKILSQYTLLTFKSKPTPESPTKHSPGTPEKIAILAERFARGESLWHPEDADMGRIPLDAERIRDALLLREKVVNKPGRTGIERLRDGRVRVRPFWEGKKYHIGVFDTEKEAQEVVEQYWKDRLGLFWEMRDQCHKWRKKKKRRSKLRCSRKTRLEKNNITTTPSLFEDNQ